jgi:hypothetical protein
MMKIPFTLWMILGLLGMVAPVWADGGLIRAQQRAGDQLVTVFTSPTPLRSGLADISVLVQDAKTGAVLAEQPILIRIRNRDTGETIAAEATSAAATNKLMQSAVLAVPTAGTWTVSASGTIDGRPIEIGFDVAVEQSLPPWLAFWRLLLLPPVAIGLFVIHRLLVALRRAPTGPDAFLAARSHRAFDLFVPRKFRPHRPRADPMVK